jgi:hypothetical protein
MSRWTSCSSRPSSCALVGEGQALARLGHDARGDARGTGTRGTSASAGTGCAGTARPRTPCDGSSCRPPPPDRRSARCSGGRAGRPGAPRRGHLHELRSSARCGWMRLTATGLLEAARAHRLGEEDLRHCRPSRGAPGGGTCPAAGRCGWQRTGPWGRARGGDRGEGAGEARALGRRSRAHLERLCRTAGAGAGAVVAHLAGEAASSSGTGRIGRPPGRLRGRREPGERFSGIRARLPPRRRRRARLWAVASGGQVATVPAPWRSRTSSARTAAWARRAAALQERPAAPRLPLGGPDRGRARAVRPDPRPGGQLRAATTARPAASGGPCRRIAGRNHADVVFVLPRRR